MSFDAFPHDQWPDVVAALAASIPWPEALAAHDLRWHAAEHAIYRRPLPSERDLAERWNWSRPKVNRTIRAERWRDPSREWTWREPTVSQERAKREPTVSQAWQEQAQETDTSEPTVSHPRANGEPTVSLTRDLFSPAPTPAPDNTENAPAPAVAPTPTPDQSHDDQPTRAPSPASRPDARGPTDGSGGPVHAGGADDASRPANEDGVPVEQAARGTGPVVAAWDRLDAIRRKNIKGAGTLKLTPSMRKYLGERLKDYSEDDLAAMVEWVTGCRCGSKQCRSCGHLQPGGYTHPQTYLRPDKCSDYVDKAKRAGFQSRPASEEQADWTESDAARLLVQRVMDTGGDIHHRDPRMVYLAKRTLRAIGGRGVWKGRALTTDWIVAWRKEWPASLADYTRQQAEGAAK